MENKEFYTIPEVAEKLAVSIDTVRNYINRKRNPLPAYRFGREYRISILEYEEWIKTNRVQPGRDGE